MSSPVFFFCRSKGEEDKNFSNNGMLKNATMQPPRLPVKPVFRFAQSVRMCCFFVVSCGEGDKKSNSVSAGEGGEIVPPVGPSRF